MCLMPGKTQSMWRVPLHHQGEQAGRETAPAKQKGRVAVVASSVRGMVWVSHSGAMRKTEHVKRLPGVTLLVNLWQ